MNDDYLWDRSGKADPEIEKLERELAEYRFKGPQEWPEAVAPESEAIEPEMPRRPAAPVIAAGRPWWSNPIPVLAAAAALTAIATIVVLRSQPESGWEVVALQGAPKLGSRSVHKEGRLAAGAWLETDAQSRARVRIGDIGNVEVAPNTRLRWVATRTPEHRLSLAHGQLHAFIYAPPRQFVVETPSAMAVDLGCEYLLESTESGDGALRVLSGWVAFQREGRESFVPAEARCEMDAASGPGTPYYEDATGPFQASLRMLDLGDRSEASARPGALQVVLDEARARDAVTLWHLLTRVSPAECAQVYQRLAALVPPPEGVDLERIGSHDRKALDLWWNALGLGSASWWRMWEGDLP